MRCFLLESVGSLQMPTSFGSFVFVILTCDRKICYEIEFEFLFRRYSDFFKPVDIRKYSDS